MANLKVNNYNNLKLRFNKDEYWDFFVNKDASTCYSGRYNGFYDKCLISYINLCDDECFDGDKWIYSKNDYAWDDSVAVEHTMHNITYCGVDNGLFTYRKDRISNKDFPEIFRGNSYEIQENDFRLKLHAVSGNTLVYDYPIHKEECCTKLNGGFYQGFFKTDCDKYQVLPSRFEDGDIYNFEFTLKKCDLEKESEHTLNDAYPNNKGIFFFLGTRAENKWIYLYDKDDAEGLESCYELGVDDFVEDGEIDKKDYIIGNFYDLDPMFDGYDPFQLGDYTNYNYYDDSLYEGDPCDWADMSDYVDVVYHRKAITIDETEPHTKLTWCCGSDDDDDASYTTEVVLTPHFRGCGCPVSYKKTIIRKEQEEDEEDELQMCSEFGDNYVVDTSEVMSLDEAVDYFEPELDISDFEYETDNGFNLAEANDYYFYTDNKFLFFNRTKTGETVASFVEGTKFMYYGRKNNFKGNLFILMNRTKTGYTVSNIDTLRNAELDKYNVYADLYDNVLAFRITDDGEIGYRLITIDCEKEGDNKVKILEGYSNKGIIPTCEWFVVNVRAIFLGGDKMKFMFYINGKLMYITKELPRIRLRKLNEINEKQEGVPYNISIGGGSQGLAETVQYNYMLTPSRVYPIEENFGGSFIGYIKSFKIYNCMFGKEIVENNYNWEVKNI